MVFGKVISFAGNANMSGLVLKSEYDMHFRNAVIVTASFKHCSNIILMRILFQGQNRHMKGIAEIDELPTELIKSDLKVNTHI